jgi:NADH dehydrogenase/NADH:ubiquinone oxidoreductase subunit G
MVIKTNSARVRNTRKATLELILSDHNQACLECIRNKNCELQDLCEEYGIRGNSFNGVRSAGEIDNLSASIVRDDSKCIKCGRVSTPVSRCKRSVCSPLSTAGLRPKSDPPMM